MDKKEYKKEREKIKKEMHKKYGDLAKKYAFSNNKIKVGDFVTDHIGTIKVDSIKFWYSSVDNLPVCVYFGLCYTKKQVPFKSGEKRNVSQMNLLNIGK